MKKSIFLVLCVFIFSVSTLSAQNSADTIQVKKGFGTTYLQGGKKLRMNDLMTITQPVPEAYESMKKAKSNYGAASVFGMAGGFLVGWPLGTAIAGGDPNWTLAGIGAGLIVVSIPFTAAFNKHAREGVRIHNESITGPTASRRVLVNMQFTGNGARLRVTF